MNDEMMRLVHVRSLWFYWEGYWMSECVGVIGKILKKNKSIGWRSVNHDVRPKRSLSLLLHLV
jgi:hypothetical protein